MSRVAVIIPVYNAEKYILATLEGVKAQTYPDFNVFVIDDCSTDQSATIVQEFCQRDARFHYHRSPSNFGGPAGPRNLGVSMSTGDLIAFCDSDDIWVAHKLATQIAAIEDSGVDMVCAAIRDFTDDDSLPHFDPPWPLVAIEEISHARLLLKNWVAMSSVIIRRSTLNAAGHFNTAKSHVAVEDFDMWLRISGAGGRIARIASPLVHYRKVPTSISANKSMMIRKALNMIGDDYERRDKRALFDLIRPIHWLLYITTSAWMRAVRKEL